MFKNDFFEKVALLGLKVFASNPIDTSVFCIKNMCLNLLTFLYDGKNEMGQMG